MPTFSYNSYSLEFSSNFQKILVKDSNGDIAEEFELDSDDHLKISADSSGTAWEISYSAPGANPKVHKYDTLGGASLSFSSPSSHARLGGLGIIDLRDISRTGNFTTTYDLDGCPIYLTYQGGSLATWVEFNGSGCYEYEEN